MHEYDTETEVSIFMKYDEIRGAFSEKPLFTRSDFIEYVGKHNPKLKDTTAGWLLYDMQKNNVIERVAHNAYRVHTDDRQKLSYEPHLSGDSTKTIEFLKERFPYVDFIVWETRALNEFANHQMARNFIFVEVEKDIAEFVFNALIENNENRVLYKPDTKEIIHYSADVTVAVIPLTSEAPTLNYTAKLEKLLVDLFANPLIPWIMSPGDFSGIFDEAFSKYYINYKLMLRYARRRGKEKKITSFIKDETRVNIVEGVHI